MDRSGDKGSTIVVIFCIESKLNPYPIGSMYAIYANIWGILMVNVTIYSIHGSYGYWIHLNLVATFAGDFFKWGGNRQEEAAQKRKEEDIKGLGKVEGHGHDIVQTYSAWIIQLHLSKFMQLTLNLFNIHLASCYILLILFSSLSTWRACWAVPLSWCRFWFWVSWLHWWADGPRVWRKALFPLLLPLFWFFYVSRAFWNIGSLNIWRSRGYFGKARLCGLWQNYTQFSLMFRHVPTFATDERRSANLHSAHRGEAFWSWYGMLYPKFPDLVGKFGETNRVSWVKYDWVRLSTTVVVILSQDFDANHRYLEKFQNRTDLRIMKGQRIADNHISYIYISYIELRTKIVCCSIFHVRIERGEALTLDVFIKESKQLVTAHGQHLLYSFCLVRSRPAEFFVRSQPRIARDAPPDWSVQFEYDEEDHGMR